MHIHIVINPAAGSNTPILNTINDVFRSHDIHWTVSITHGPGDGARQARQAVEAGAELVAAYGGDGTVMDVANGLAAHDTPMAILPGGTGNAMAAELGIPLALRQAAELICAQEYRLRAVDMGQTGERLFMLRASIGLQATLTERATREMKDRFGNLAYLISAIQVLDEQQRAAYRLTIDGEEVESEGISCLVNNSGSIGGLNARLAADVDPSDGLLDVFIIQDNFDSAISMAASVLELEGWLTEALQRWQGREITVRANPPQPIRIDGEMHDETTPIAIQVVPEAVRVVVPQAD